MREIARKAVDRITARTLDDTYRFEDERADMLDAIAETLRAKAHELREARINSPAENDDRHSDA